MVTVIQQNFKLFTFFELTPDLACIAGKDGYFKKVNHAMIEKTGYTEAELLERPLASFIHPEDKELALEKSMLLLKGEVLHNFVNRYIKKNGQLLWLEWTSVYSSEYDMVFALAKDVTEKKLAENELEEKFARYKELTSHFKSTIEKDKKDIAHGLHEELAQLVAAVKMDIGWIASHPEGLPESSRNRIKHALETSSLLVKSIQRISFAISPNLIDEFGLKTTLEFLCNEFSILNGIPCDLQCMQDEKFLSYEMKIDFFRICQEALTNIINHAEAKHVHITVSETKDSIELSIVDDGKGFDTSLPTTTTGLQDMIGRAVSINGALKVTSDSGKGTTILVSVPKTATA